MLLLVELVRTERTTPGRLRLAAILGSRASAVALGEAVPGDRDLETVLGALCADTVAGVRSALALLQLALTLLRGPQRAPWIEAGCRPAIEVSEAWAVCPCEGHAEQARTVAAEMEVRADEADAASTHQGDWWSYQAVRVAHCIPGAIALAAGLPQPCPADPITEDPAQLLIGVCREFSGLPSHVQRTEDQALDVLRAEVLPWLLGRADPVRERVRSLR